jgi:hypothetical protein
LDSRAVLTPACIAHPIDRLIVSYPAAALPRCDLPSQANVDVHAMSAVIPFMKTRAKNAL